MTPEQQNRLWDAINRYVVACGGDPSKHVYGNTTRQKAVADVSAVIREANETLRRDLDAWGHDRDCARLQARGRPNDDSVACDCNLESYGFGR